MLLKWCSMCFWFREKGTTICLGEFGKAAGKRRFGRRKERKGSSRGNEMGKSYSIPVLLDLKTNGNY